MQIALLKWAPYSGISFAVGSGPIAIAFDGANIWVANHNSANVTKLRASDGAVLGTFAVGNSPFGIAFDGERASDGATLGTFAVGVAPYGIAFDGANIWVANLASLTKL